MPLFEHDWPCHPNCDVIIEGHPYEELDIIELLWQEVGCGMDIVEYAAKMGFGRAIESLSEANEIKNI